MHIDVEGLNVFQGEMLPNETRLAGWAALKHALGVQGPVRGPACVSAKHVSGSTREEGRWRVFDKRYWPGDTFADHLVFALRHETLDLLLLKRIFNAVEPETVEEFVRKTPTGIPARRVWFLYELLTEHTLDLRDDPGGHLLMPSTKNTTSPPGRACQSAIGCATTCWERANSVPSSAGPHC